MSDDRDALTHLLAMGPTSSTVRTTGNVVEGSELKVIRKAEMEGYQVSRLGLNFNHRDEPTVLTIGTRMTYGGGLDAEDLLREAHAILLSRPRGSILEMPFRVHEGRHIMRVRKPFVTEITTLEADGLVYTAQAMVRARDGNRNR